MILKIGDKLIREDSVIEIDPHDGDGVHAVLCTEYGYRYFAGQDADDLRTVAADPVYRLILFGIPTGFPAVADHNDYVDGVTIDINRLAALLRERNGAASQAAPVASDGAEDLFPLEWTKEYDGADNPIYDAASPYRDDDSPFYWRVDPVMVGGKIRWSLAKSEAETLQLEERSLEFDTAEEAKAWCQIRANEIVREAKAKGDLAATKEG